MTAPFPLKPLELKGWERERHRIHSLLLFALIHAKWNGNKYGEIGDYGRWRAAQQVGSANTASGQKLYGGGTYQGHNIAALAVDGEGRIMDFDFNHNAIFDSTVEHAESRLVRRLFALNQIYSPWQALNRDAAGHAGLAAGAGFGRMRQQRNLFATAISDRAAPPRTGSDPAAEIAPKPPVGYATLLKDVTIYTSLESCAQCSGSCVWPA